MPPIVQTIAWSMAPTWLLDRSARRQGDTFTQTFGPSGFKLVHFSDPQAVKTLLTAPEEIAPKPEGGAGAPMWVLGRNSLSVLVGAEHMRQRKLLLPSFHGERLREHERVIVETTQGAMATWQLGQPIPMQHHIRLITLDVIMEMVFGMHADRTTQLRSTIVELMDLNYRMVGLRALVGRGGDARPKDKLGRTLDRLDAQIYAEIRHRRQQSDVADRSDVMSMLLVARDEDGEQLTDVEVRDELVTLLLAGHETTATTVAWAIELLVRHPDKLDRLIAEIDTPGDGVGDRYLTAVIQETLRVRPVQPSVARMVTQDFQVGRFTLPAGTWAVASIYLTNRNPRVYADPAAFKPERFLEDAPETYSWLPFGGGIRRCIGAALAQMETKLILRTVLAELEPRTPAGWRARRSEGMRWAHRTLAPSRGAMVVWQRRAPRRSDNGSMTAAVAAQTGPDVAPHGTE